MNYKDQLQNYMSKYKQHQSKENDLDNSKIPNQKYKTQQNLASSVLTGSMAFEARNYQRVMEECLDFNNVEAKTVK
jgi:hypothetical protein